MISQFEVGQSVRNRHDHIQTSGLGRLRKFHLTMPPQTLLSLPDFSVCDHRLIYLSQKASNYPEPTDQSIDRSSVFRSQINGFLMTNSALV